MRRFRSAITGRFVQAATWRRHPRVTVAESLELQRYVAALEARCLELRRMHSYAWKADEARAVHEEREHHHKLRAAVRANR